MKIKTIYTIGLLLIFVMITMSCRTSSNGHKTIKWSKIKTESGIKDSLLARLPEPPTPSGVIALLEKEKITHSELEDGVIYASIPAKTGDLFVSKTWLIEFRFDENNTFKEVSVRAGYTGP